MALWYELASLPLKSVVKTLQSLPIEFDNARDSNTRGNHSEQEFYTEKKMDGRKNNTKLKNNHKQYDSEASSDNDSESTTSSEDVIEIECSRLDDEEADSFISSDINEKNLQKFLQQEMDFYNKAFPQAVLRRKSHSTSTRLGKYDPRRNNSLPGHTTQHYEDFNFNSLQLH